MATKEVEALKPEEEEEDILIRAEGLTKFFPVRRSLFDVLRGVPPLYVKAVDHISFYIKKGEMFGLVGESGCGKTTTGKLLVRLLEPTDGAVYFNGVNIYELKGKALREFRKKVQIIFQDPYESLNPRMTVYDIIAEPLKVLGLTKSRREEEERVREALENVELTPPEDFYLRYPHELSGGQRQRVAVARALVVNPQFIVADEPVSMLDVSIRAEVLNVMVNIQDKFGVAFVFITHDMAYARHLCDRMAVMYLGKIVEMGDTESIIFNPKHPYTKALLLAVPVPDPDAERTKVVIKGEVPTPINPPPGCRFAPRCPEVMDICRKEEPPLVEVAGRYVACHLYT